MTIAARLHHPRASIRLAAKREAKVNEELRQFIAARDHIANPGKMVRRPWWIGKDEAA